jgi:hypothetical protein
MQLLRRTLIFIAIVQLFFGLTFLVAPSQFANLVDLPAAPAWVNWLFAMMGARFIGYAVGLVVAARDPQRHQTWIATMIGIQAVDWLATIIYLLRDSLTLTQVSTAAFLPIIFIIILATRFPRQSAPTPTT